MVCEARDAAEGERWRSGRQGGGREGGGREAVQRETQKRAKGGEAGDSAKGERRCSGRSGKARAAEINASKEPPLQIARCGAGPTGERKNCPSGSTAQPETLTTRVPARRSCRNWRCESTRPVAAHNTNQMPAIVSVCGSLRPSSGCSASGGKNHSHAST